MRLHPARIIANCFCDLIDPRIERVKQHQLLAILISALSAIISGAET